MAIFVAKIVRGKNGGEKDTSRDDLKEERVEEGGAAAAFSCAIVFAFNRCNIDRWNWL